MRSRTLALAVLALLTPAAARAFSSGPPPNEVGQCGTGGTCDGCHSNPGLPSMATISVTLNGAPAPVPPATGLYTPGANYTLVVSVLERNAATRCQHMRRTTACGTVEANQCVFGFQMTAVTEASCAAAGQVAAGCFVMTNAVDTQCQGGSCACTPTPQPVRYPEQTCAGHIPAPGVLDSRTWTFDWTAPAAGTGAVHFYYYVNSANGNGNNSGDQPYPGDFLLEEDIVPPGCGLLRAAIASISPPPPQFKSAILFADTTTCAPEAVPPGPPFIPNYTALGTATVEPIPGLDAMVVYKVSCPCAGTLRLRKSATDVVGVWQ